MLAYVLATASPGTASMIPSRLEGWWLGTAVAAIAVVVMSPRRPGDPLRSTAADTAHIFGIEVRAIAKGTATPGLRSDSLSAEGRLRSLFNAAPYRPTGLATVDQALSSVVELLAWVNDLIGDTYADLDQLGDLRPADRRLLAGVGETLEAVAGMLLDDDLRPDLDQLERLRHDSIEAVRHLDGSERRFQAAVHASFHARTIAVAVRGVAADALIASGRATPQTVAEQRQRWIPGGSVDSDRAGQGSTVVTEGSTAVSAASILLRHTSLRSVWARNSARGAVAVTAAIVLADLTNVQHGFWVVLGTLSVLRTTATATGGTAARALIGTAVGVLAGAGIVVGVGTDTTVLWLAFPLAVLIAAYAPGVAPFGVGQAAFTAMLVVLYNLLIPVGWKVGVVRVGDIAAGCGISILVGALLWPRGATAVVADDLRDAFTTAGRYLVEAADWALGRANERPEGGQAALVAGLRLDDALRALLTEQGTKSMAKEDLWALVASAQRLRLTASSVAELPAPPATGSTGAVLSDRARALEEWYRTVGTHIHRGWPPQLAPLDPLPPPGPEAGPPEYRRACQTYVDQHLRHLHRHHGEVIEPAGSLGRAVKRPWWRAADARTDDPRVAKLQASPG